MAENLPETTPSIIIDSGSSCTRAGFAQDAKPRSVFSNVVLTLPDAKTKLIGDSALKRATCLDLPLQFPVSEGCVTNWDQMENIWRYVIFDALQVKNISDHPLVLTETILTPKANREKATQIFFETFEVPALAVFLRPTLAAAAWGSKDAIVVHCGAETLSTASVVQNPNTLSPLVLFSSAVHRTKFGGKKMSEILRNSILQGKETLGVPSFSEWNLLKEKVSVCSDSMELSDLSNRKQSNYTFQNGTVIEFEEKNRFLCSEILFQPSKFGFEFASLPELIFNTVEDPTNFNTNSINLNLKVVKDVILAGGATMMPGFPARLDRELKAVSSSFRVLSREDQNFIYWKGGSMLATAPDFFQHRELFSLEEYNESGPSITHRRHCF